ncbi:H repeat-associated yhhI domain protein, partial [Escherichia coli B106]
DELIDFTFEWKGLKKLCVAVSFRSRTAEQKKEPKNDGQILYQFC